MKKRAGVLPVMLMLAVCGCDKAPTETGNLYPTATPPLIVDVAGTWTGTLTYVGGSETVTVSITQDTDRVHAAWSTPRRGQGRFEGAFLANHPTADLAGTITLQHPQHCELSPVRVGGEPTGRSLRLTGSGYCQFDPFPVTLDLKRSIP